MSVIGKQLHGFVVFWIAALVGSVFTYLVLMNAAQGKGVYAFIAGGILASLNLMFILVESRPKWYPQRVLTDKHLSTLLLAIGYGLVLGVLSGWGTIGLSLTLILLFVTTGLSVITCAPSH